MPRSKIMKTYARWTSLSALRSGAPIKGRRDVYKIIDSTDFDVPLDRNRGSIQKEEFDCWHKKTLEMMVGCHNGLEGQYGWAAKIVNVYLKTLCYVGDEGRDGIRECLHPPIDGGLWKGIRRKFAADAQLLDRTHYRETIKAIGSYDDYTIILGGLRQVAVKLECYLAGC